GLLAPLRQGLGAVDLGAEPLVVEGEAGGVVGEDVAPAGLVFEAGQAFEQLAVVLEEWRLGVELIFNERLVDEDFAGVGGIDGAVVDRAGGGNLELAEAHALAGDNAAAAAIPARIAVMAL